MLSILFLKYECDRKRLMKSRLGLGVPPENAMGRRWSHSFLGKGFQSEGTAIVDALRNAF